MNDYTKLYREMMVFVNWFVTDDGKIVSNDEEFTKKMEEKVPEEIRRRGTNSIMDYIFTKMIGRE